MKTISAIILAKNEEQTIARTIDSLSFCNEVIVIDDYSSDMTAQIAKDKNCVVFQMELNNDFSKQRNLAMNKAKNEWIFFVDADEYVTPELAKEILDTQSQTILAYSIPRKDYFWGNTLHYGETMSAHKKGIIRLVKRGSGAWEGAVHEVYSTNGPTKKLKNPLIHYAHTSLTEFISSINVYSTIRAKELFAKGKKVNSLELIFFPLFKFMYTYFFLLGFLDGPAGFVYSFSMSLHSFLVRAKLKTYYD